MKKIVVIGGGISGLTAGIYARLVGFETEICEKNTVPGGECTGWDRQRYHIDNCIHWMIGTAPGTELHKVWETTGALGTVGVRRRNVMYASEKDGARLNLWDDADQTEAELLALSPEDEKAIRELMADCRLAEKVMIPAETPPELLKGFGGLKLLCESGPIFKLWGKYKGMDIADLAAKFRHPLIRAMLSDFCPADSPAHSFPIAYGNFLSGDGGIPAGGSKAMALRMAERFRSLGGVFRYGAPVEKATLAGGNIASVRLADGTEVTADWFIWAADPFYLFEKLIGTQYMDDIFRAYYTKPEDYKIYAMFQAAWAVDAAEDLPDGEVNLDVSDLRTESWMGGRVSLKTYSYEPSFAPEGKQILQALWGCDRSAYPYFKGLAADKAAYDAKKAEFAGLLGKRITERWPEYAGKLTLLDSWTPVTYERYCNAWQGYNQACVFTKRAGRNPYPSAKVKGIGNLILAGQWLSAPGGLPGAAIQGKYAVQRILHQEGRPIKL